MKHEHKSVNEIIATLQSLRADAESTAHRQHLQAAQEHRHQLQDTREKAHQLLLQSVSPHLQRAYELSLQRAEIEWLYWVHRRALDQSDLEADVREAHSRELAYHKERQLAQLSDVPALNLQEQDALLQALICHAVEQYVDEALAIRPSAA